MIHVKTPATTANMGCGFDSIGMALQLYNHLWVEERGSGLSIQIVKEQPIPIPTTENNLIYRTMADFYQMVGKSIPKGLLLIQEDNVPLTRGLGSSAACIVSGLLAANALSKANLPVSDLIQIAAKIEGHPDNVAPAFTGGIAVGAMDKDLKYVHVKAPEDLTFAVMIPSFPLSTEKARKALPKTVPHKDAVFNVSRAGLLMASLLSGSYENLNTAMDDKLHQPYRKTIIPNMEQIFKKAKEYGAKGVFLSGAGPTIIAVIHQNEYFANHMHHYLYSLKGNWTLHMIEADNCGAVVTTGDPYIADGCR